MEPLLRELLCTRESRPCYLIELTWKLPNGLIALISLLNYSHVSQQGPKLVPALVGEQMPILSVISNSTSGNSPTPNRMHDPRCGANQQSVFDGEDSHPR